MPKKRHISVKKRNKKFRKIKYLLTSNNIKYKKILSVGVGSGKIETAFAKDGCMVYGVDVVDKCKTKKFNFRLIKDEKLPYPDNYFDLVISNHVIEHVNNQELHLNEIYRVLKNKGHLYLATPNKFAIMEPHYKVPFLSWFPKNIASKLVIALGKNNFYDILPLTKWGLDNLLLNSNFTFFHLENQALLFYLKNKKNVKILKNIIISRFFRNIFSFVTPSFIIIAIKK